MDIVGYIGYGVLIFLAVTWTIGVRRTLDAAVPTISGALFFVVTTVILGVSEMSKLHSLWMIPSGFALTFLLSFSRVYAPPIFGLFRLLASGFASLVRVGIPAERIKAAQDAGLRAAAEEWAAQRENKEK
jgi:hypothetical protein